MSKYTAAVRLRRKGLTVPSDDVNSGPGFVRCCLFWWVVVLTGLAISAYLWVYLNGQLGHGFPYNTLAFMPSERLSDFTAFSQPFQHFGTAQFWPDLADLGFNYPAPAAYVYLFFFRLIPHHPYAAAVMYDATVAGAAFLAAALMAFSVRRTELAGPIAAVLLLTFVTSYPLMFLVDRANVEGAAWVAAVLGIWAFMRGRGGLAALFLGCAAAIKLAPLVLVFLFLRKRDWRNAAVFVSLFVGLNILAMWFAAPHLWRTFGLIGTGLTGFVHARVQAFDAAGIGVDHSLFSVVKQGLIWSCYVARLSKPVLGRMINTAYYVYIGGWLAMGVVLIRWFRRLPMLNCMFALFIVQTIAPPLSYDYTLVYLYIPWAVFLVVFLLQEVSSRRTDFALSTALAVLIPYAIVFTPQQCYLVIGGIGHTSPLGDSGHIGFAGQVKALALLYLLVVAALNPMPCRIFGEADRAEWHRPAALSPPVGPGPV